MYTGPHIIKDGLVFGYDTGYGIADNVTGTRFYPGEATENLANTESLRTMANYGGGTTTYAEAPEKGPGWKKVTITAINGSNHRLSKFPYISHPTNTTRIYSLELDFTGTSGYYVRGDGFTGLAPNVSTSGVHSWTLATTTNSGVFALFLNNGRAAVTGLNDVIYYRYYQVEAKGHATPFTATTRSSTASLIDLKKTANIDVSNVSFDSTGQPEFDGTNDVITTSFPATTIPNVTIEAVVYRNQATTRYEAIVQNNNASDDALYVNPSGVLMFWPCGSSSLTVPTGQWSHVAVSYNGTTLTYIVNGTTQVVTATCTDITDWDFLRIGGHGTTDGERWIGKIAVAKVYEKSLSAAELTQNYNAYKNRFSI